MFGVVEACLTRLSKCQLLKKGHYTKLSLLPKNGRLGLLGRTNTWRTQRSLGWQLIALYKGQYERCNLWEVCGFYDQTGVSMPV